MRGERSEKDGQASGVSLAKAVGGSRVSIVVTDPTLPDNPISYVNDAFERLTLYPREQALGRNCRFLQGPGTDPEDVERIREGLRNGDEFAVTLTNHMADGRPFRNQLLVTPVHDDDDGNLTAYFGVQRRVDAEEAALRSRSEISAETMLRELQHRVKNHLAMVVSMIRMQARREETPKAFNDLSYRIEALSLLYDELFEASQSSDGRIPEDVAADKYLTRVAQAVAGIEARDSVSLDLELEAIRLPFDTTARLGLLLSEFMTNAYKHAFDGRETGRIEVRLTRGADGGVRLEVRDDGVGLPDGSSWPLDADSLKDQHRRTETADSASAAAGLGGSIVDGLSRSIDGRLSVQSDGANGTCFALDLPPQPGADDGEDAPRPAEA